ncbi:MAG: hypothetical protein BZ138_08385 [Methanosphaera sp. rholeuAM270]|nr:MAG: hypothetical protein BZ138_08385 [Methanosphaera sp. rholeuAM270]
MSNVKIITKNVPHSKEEEVLERFKEFQQALIEKDEKTLNEIMEDDYILTHMSGKTQTKNEFIEEIINGTLNYYNSTIIEPEISFINENLARIIALVKLDAKVYGIKGTWTLNTDIAMKKVDKQWFLNKWKN